MNKCTVALEAALKGKERNMMDFLYHNGLITDDSSVKTSLGVADKVHELVDEIKNRVKQDKGGYFVLLGCLTQGGPQYLPLVNILTEEYNRVNGGEDEMQNEQTCEFPCECMAVHAPRGNGPTTFSSYLVMTILR